MLINQWIQVLERKKIKIRKLYKKRMIILLNNHVAHFFAVQNQQIMILRIKMVKKSI